MSCSATSWIQAGVVGSRTADSNVPSPRGGVLSAASAGRRCREVQFAIRRRGACDTRRPAKPDPANRSRTPVRSCDSGTGFTSSSCGAAEGAGAADLARYPGHACRAHGRRVSAYPPGRRGLQARLRDPLPAARRAWSSPLSPACGPAVRPAAWPRLSSARAALRSSRCRVARRVRVDLTLPSLASIIARRRVVAVVGRPDHIFIICIVLASTSPGGSRLGRVADCARASLMCASVSSTSTRNQPAIEHRQWCAPPPNNHATQMINRFCDHLRSTRHRHRSIHPSTIQLLAK